jgi:hypothetical protein
VGTVISAGSKIGYQWRSARFLGEVPYAACQAASARIIIASLARTWRGLLDVADDQPATPQFG